jgi:3-dehydroquinate synthase
MRKGTAIRVNIPGAMGRSYPIVIRPGALAALPAHLAPLLPSRIHVITDRNVWGAAGAKIRATLEPLGIPFAASVLPPGEGAKSVRGVERVWRDLIRAGCDRRSAIVAFGGGVVGDLAGFAAATVLRGIDFIQVPTTLLAMVDSSVGGKTGIDLPEGKNLVGSFHQPRAVLADLDLLRTLPRRQVLCGWAELIKTAAIWDASIFGWIERRREDLLRPDPAALGRAVLSACRIKADVVGRDERERGLRMVLNFGHTLGHALEAGHSYRGLLHGEAVSLGMVFAARLGETLGRSESGTADRLGRLLDVFGLPVRPPAIPLRRILAAMERDKKRGPRGLRWVLLRRIGEAEVADGLSWGAVRREIVRFLEEVSPPQRRRGHRDGRK